MSDFTLFLDSTSVLQIGLAILLGGLIGLEREIHGRPAGLRTHIIVCLGATIMVMAAEFYHGLVSQDGVVFNPDRIAAGIITGIGFLGAGAIMKEGTLIRGLTTAGGIWFVAGLGIVIGKKHYALAVWAAALAWLLLFLLRHLEKWLPSRSYKDMSIKVSLGETARVEKNCLQILSESGVEVDEKRIHIDNEKKTTELSFTLEFHRREDNLGEIVGKVSQCPGVLEVKC